MFDVELNPMEAAVSDVVEPVDVTVAPEACAVVVVVDVLASFLSVEVTLVPVVLAKMLPCDA